MNQPKRYTRYNSTITISVFYEQYQLKKFNFNPEYQRESGIWKTKDKEFLIDTIFKNFPMPPIFCEQKINKGVTSYDIIDGKQRLSAIIDFINDKICLPIDFSNDEYGYTPLNGKKMSEIVSMAQGENSLFADEIAETFLDTFWSYKISMEYIEKPDTNIVRGIFDRLNRNGERLNSAELRKAKYYDSEIYKQILTLSEQKDICEIIPKNIRQKHVNFWTEVFIFVAENKINTGNANNIDKQIEKLSKYSAKDIKDLKNIVLEIIKTYSSWKLDLEKYKISKEVHMYNLLYLAYGVYKKEVIVNNIQTVLNEFFTELRSAGINSRNKHVVEYYNTTQSGSKSLTQREKRFNALKSYLMENN